MIPNIIHFVFGLEADFGNRPFMPFHYIAIKSAFDINKPDKIYFVCAHEPQSEWFDRCKPFIEIVKIEPPQHIFGNKLYHYAHKSDIVRLERLIQYGGIYLDIDTICVKPLTPFLQYDCVMGKEYKFINHYPKDLFNRILYRLNWLRSKPVKTFVGLCNAVILAKPKAEFLIRWYDSYRYFRSTGQDVYWGEHSIKIPGMFSQIYRDEIFIVEDDYFFNPSYDSDGLKNLFVQNLAFPKAYVHHLWESIAWEEYLEKLQPDEINTINSSYNILARYFLK